MRKHTSLKKYKPILREASKKAYIKPSKGDEFWKTFQMRAVYGPYVVTMAALARREEQQRVKEEKMRTAKCRESRQKQRAKEGPDGQEEEVDSDFSP